MKKTFLKPMLMLAALILMATTACANPGSQDTQKPAQADTVEVMSQVMKIFVKWLTIKKEVNLRLIFVTLFVKIELSGTLLFLMVDMVLI